MTINKQEDNNVYMIGSEQMPGDSFVNTSERDGSEGDTADNFQPLQTPEVQAPQTDNPMQPVFVSSSQSTSPIWLEVLKILVVPVFSVFSSLSLPIFIILIQTKLDSHKTLSLQEKIFRPLVPYLILSVFRTWLLRNSIGHRMNGRIDSAILVPDNTFKDTPWHVLAALIANFSSFTNAFLVAFIILPTTHPILLVGGSITLGILNYMTNLCTEVVDAFRKHIEHKNQRINPFFKQKYINSIIYKQVGAFGLLLREILPIANGLIYTQAATQTVTSLMSNTAFKSLIPLINIPLALKIYSGTAYSTRFELTQFRDNLKATGEPFEVENMLSNSSSPTLRMMGGVINGRALIDIFKWLNFSTYTSVNFILMYAMIGRITLLRKGLHQYLSSTNTTAVEANQEGMLMSYCLGKQEAIRLAPNIEIGITCVAISLGMIGIFAKSATLHKYARDNYDHRVERVAVELDIEEIAQTP